jgi:predicted aldo/keto reductase-like oxidoreductase
MKEMVYREFGKTGLRVSRFGLGCMRFPPDEAEAVRMVRRAIERGVNYLDTAYVYGNSETITGKALQDGYRDRVVLATKSPIWNIASHADFEKYLDRELARLGTDHIDVYLLHNLNTDNWNKVRRYDGLTFLDKMAAKGKILHKGFSLHNTLAAFREIIDAFDWEMTQIQLNILDEENQAGVEGLRYAAARGIPVVIMEPLRGGFLAGDAPPAVAALIDAFPERRSLMEWCFRWLYDMPEVSVVLSGTSTMAQLEENIDIFADAAPNVMTAAERGLLRQIREAFESSPSVACTGCAYCLPCPAGVAIPDIFKLYNSYQLVKPNPVDIFMYRNVHMAEGTAADSCTGCGACQDLCPQGLAAPELLPLIHKELMQAPMPG